MKGKFITFEGPEGSGKSTQIKMLSDYLDKAGHECLCTREPGGPRISEIVRDVLLDSENKNMSARTELFLILASRAQHTEEVIVPALRQGKIVLCDRYTDSTLAYQSFGRGFDLDFTKKICYFATSDLKPDLTFLLDIDAETGLKRARNNAPGGMPDRLENEAIEFHKKVRNGFLKLAETEPERIVVLNAGESMDKIHSRIVKRVNQLLKV